MTRAAVKTHYVTLRLLFDEPVTRRAAVCAAKASMPSKTLVALQSVTDSKTKAITRRLVSFKIKRIC